MFELLVKSGESSYLRNCQVKVGVWGVTMHPRHHDPYLRPGLSGGDGEGHLLTWLGFHTAPV